MGTKNESTSQVGAGRRGARAISQHNATPRRNPSAGAAAGSKRFILGGFVVGRLAISVADVQTNTCTYSADEAFGTKIADVTSSPCFHPTGKPKYAIEVRRGYFAPKKADDPREAAKREIQEAVLSQNEIFDLPMSLQTQYFKTEDGGTKLSVV